MRKLVTLMLAFVLALNCHAQTIVNGQVQTPAPGAQFVSDAAGNIQGLKASSGTIPLSVQTPVGSLGLLPLPGFSTIAGDATNGVIINTQLPSTCASFYGVRLIYLNGDTVNTQAYDGVKVAGAPKSISGGNSSLTFSSFVTVNGSQSFAVPVAVTGAGGQVIPGQTVTDFIPVSSVARTDTVGAPLLLRVASHLAPSANSTSHPNYNGTNFTNYNALAANPGLIYGTYNFSGTGATLAQLTSNGNSVLNSGGTENPFAAVFYCNGQTTDVWAFGDSIWQGHGTTSNLAGITEYLTFNSYTNPTQWVGSNFATSGQTTVDTWARLKKALGAAAAANQLPKYILIKGWTPNDTPINTQSTYNQTWAYVTDMVNYALQVGVQPIVSTAPFASGYTCSYIQTNNARVMALPASVRKVDLFNLWTPGCTWNASYNSGDGIHPNDAGTSAAANLILQTVNY